MRRLIILGTMADPHVQRVSSLVEEMGGDYIAIDYLNEGDLTMRQNGRMFEWFANNEAISSNDIIWNRLKLWFGSPFFFKDEVSGENKAENYRRNMVRRQEWIGALHSLKTMHAATVINSPAGVMRMSKPLQQYIAANLGMKSPKTLITTSKSQLETFIGSNDSVIIKGYGGSKIYTNREFARPEAIMTMRLSHDEISSVEERSLKACPQLFQEEVIKEYELRVFATKSDLRGFRIDSQKFSSTEVDWRFGNTFLDFSPIEIDESLRDGIFGFLEEFQLHYGSFDFIVDRKGESWFLECNPDGQWGFLETEDEALCSKMLAEQLVAVMKANTKNSKR